MAADFQALHNETHKDVKITKFQDVSDLKTQHALGIVVHEFSTAGAQYPIAFVQDENETFLPVAIMSLEPNSNLFVNDDGKWGGMYMPARYTHKPFTVSRHPEDQNMFAIGIDMNSPLISKEEGEALFTDAGEETEYMKQRKEAIMKYVEHEQVTQGFSNYLKDKGLFHAQNITVQVRDKEFNLTGLHMIDEKKLNELSDEEFVELRKRGYLAPIYAHLSSLHQVTRLIQKKGERMGQDA
jgi:hypothetical protein